MLVKKLNAGNPRFILQSVRDGRAEKAGSGGERGGDPDSRGRRGPHGHPRLQPLAERLRGEPGGLAKLIEAGDIQLDTKNFTPGAGDEPLDLRLKEFELLAALASTPGELRSREELAKEVWGHAGVGSSRTIDVHIRRIRAALEQNSSYEYIHTARGLGYRFEPTPRRSAESLSERRV